MQDIFILFGVVFIHQINGITNCCVASRYHTESPIEFIDKKDTINKESFSSDAEVLPAKSDIIKTNVKGLAAVVSNSEDNVDNVKKATVEGDINQYQREVKSVNSSFDGENNNTKSKGMSEFVVSAVSGWDDKLKMLNHSELLPGHYSNNTEEEDTEETRTETRDINANSTETEGKNNTSADGKILHTNPKVKDATQASTRSGIITSASNSTGEDGDTVSDTGPEPCIAGQLCEQVDKTKLLLAEHSGNIDNQTELFTENLMQCEEKNQALEGRIARLTQTGLQQEKLLTEEEGAITEEEKAVTALRSGNGKSIKKPPTQEDTFSNLLQQLNILDAKGAVGGVSMDDSKDENATVLYASKGSKKTVLGPQSYSSPEDVISIPKDQKELMLKLGELAKGLDHSRNVDKQTELFLQKLKQCEIKNDAMEQHVTSLSKIIGQQKNLLREQEGVLREEEEVVSLLMSAKGQELISKLAIQEEKTRYKKAKIERRRNNTLSRYQPRVEDVTKLAGKPGVDDTSLSNAKPSSFAKDKGDVMLKIEELRKDLGNVMSNWDDKVKMLNQYEEKLKQQIARHEGNLKDIETKDKDLVTMVHSNGAKIRDLKKLGTRFILVDRAKAKRLKETLGKADKMTYTNLDPTILKVMEKAVRIEDKVRTVEDKIECDHKKLTHGPRLVVGNGPTGKVPGMVSPIVSPDIDCMITPPLSATIDNDKQSPCDQPCDPPTSATIVSEKQSPCDDDPCDPPPSATIVSEKQSPCDEPCDPPSSPPIVSEKQSPCDHPCDHPCDPFITDDLTMNTLSSPCPHKPDSKKPGGNPVINIDHQVHINLKN